MALRYATASCLAYVAFLSALRLFVAVARRGVDGNPFEVIDASAPAGRSDDPSADPSPAATPIRGADAYDLPFPDVDEGILVWIPLLLVGSAVVAVLYTIWIAPVLVAELILDAMIISSLARRFARIEPTSWITSSFRQTWLPFLVILVSATLAGLFLQLIAPGAHSIGDVWAADG